MKAHDFQTQRTKIAERGKRKKKKAERSSLIIPFLSKALPLAQPSCRSYRVTICVAVKLEHRIVREKAQLFWLGFQRAGSRSIVSRALGTGRAGGRLCSRNEPPGFQFWPS